MQRGLKDGSKIASSGKGTRVSPAACRYPDKLKGENTAAPTNRAGFDQREMGLASGGDAHQKSAKNLQSRTHTLLEDSYNHVWREEKSTELNILEAILVIKTITLHL